MIDLVRLSATFLLPALLTAGTLSVRIRDESGAPVAARVYLTDAEGKLHAPPGSIVYARTRDVTEEHFVPPGGAFKIEVPAGVYRIQIHRGNEYRPVSDVFPLPQTGMTIRDYRLTRWAEISSSGWYAGDMHLHRPLHDVPVLMESEDLHVAIPISRWRYGRNDIREDPDLNAWLAKSNARGEIQAAPRRWFSVLNEELEPPSSALLVSNLGKERSRLEFPLETYGAQLRARGALVDSEKATSLELPAIAALGGCDVVGLANNHFWRAGFYDHSWGAWPDRLVRDRPQTCAGFALAGFDLYYALLNVGFPLKLSAGSANGVHPVPPGFSRIYAHVPGEFTLERWFDAVKAGRSFVTTGPLLLLTVDGREPGQELRPPKFPLTVTARVRLLSPDPVSSVELVVNGDVQPVKLAGDKTGTLQVPLETTSWIAARWLAPGDKTCSVAHTSPLYVRNGSEPLPVRRSDAEYLLSRVESLITDVKTSRMEPGNPVPVIVPAGDTLRLLERARDLYRGKLAAAVE